MPMQANTESARVQLVMRVSSRERGRSGCASAPRPDLSEMESSPVSKVAAVDDGVLAGVDVDAVGCAFEGGVAEGDVFAVDGMGGPHAELLGVEVFDEDVLAVGELDECGVAEVGGALDAAAEGWVADDFACADEPMFSASVAEMKPL